MPSPPTTPRPGLTGAAVLGAVCITLWTVDVAVNLQHLHRLFLRNAFPAPASDYATLFLLDALPAVAIAAVSLVGAALWARRGAVGFAARAAVLAAALTCAMVVGFEIRLVWEDTLPHRMPSVRPVHLILAGLCGLGTLGLLARSGSKGPWSFTRILKYILYPALILSVAGLAAHSSLGGWSAPVLINGVAAVVLAGAVAVPSLRRRPVARAAVAWLPVALAVVMAADGIGARATMGRWSEATPSGPAGNRPSIFLIVLDTLRADHLQRYGYGRNTMPALETWADSAVVFDRAVSPAGWTSPAHVSMLTGEPVSIHGVHYAIEPGVFATGPVENLTWLPNEMARAGYVTLAVSANHLALPRGTQGFHRTIVPHRYRWHFSTIGARIDRAWPVLGRLSERSRWRLPYMDAAGIVDLVQRAVPDGDAPVFCLVNLLDAHSPYAPPAWAYRELGGTGDRPFHRYALAHELTLRWPSLPPAAADYLTDLYDAEIRAMDAELDRLLRWIDERFGRGAIVIVTSDHGEELGENGRVGHEFGLGQSLIHVPLFVRASHLPPGRVSEVADLRGVFGFVGEIAAGRRPGVAPFTRTPSFHGLSERYPSGFSIDDFGPEYARFWISIVEGDLKAVGPSVAGFELFDVGSSGFDKEIATDPSLAPDLQRRIDAYFETHRDMREGQRQPASEEELRRLRALGYIQ